MTLAEKLYGLRKKNGLSQERLAEKLGVSRQAISKWETGLSVPESDKLIAVSDFFHVSLDYLLKEDADLTEAAYETKTDGTEKDGGTGRRLGLTVCIGGIAGMIVWGLISVFAPSTSDSLAASSAIELDGSGIFVLICLFAVVLGTFLLLKDGKNNK